MKLKEQIKRFWTLDVHGHKGFTLVELIIVIAILAILSGVAVAGYSSYIKKANMQADMTLIAEIENALMLAYYSGEITEGGYVVLSKDGAPKFSDEGQTTQQITDALKAAFGDNLNALTLKYEGWSDDGLLALAAGQAGAGAVGNSSYMSSSVGELLENVVRLTTAASGFLEDVDDTTKYNSLCTVFDGDVFEELATKAGLVKDGKFVEGVTDEQIGNLMVLAVAQEMANQQNGGQVSGGAQLAQSYALVKAFVLSGRGGNTAEVQFEKMNMKLESAKNLDEVSAAIDGFLLDEDGNEIQELAKALDEYSNDTDSVMTDLEAFGAIMGGVNAVKDSYLDADKLNDITLYTTSGVEDQLKTYISAAAMMGSLSEAEKTALLQAAQLGAVVIMITQDGHILVTPAQAQS